MALTGLTFRTIIEGIINTRKQIANVAQQIRTAELAKGKKLSAGKKVKACWRSQPPEDCIHVIIARPPGK